MITYHCVFVCDGIWFLYALLYAGHSESIDIKSLFMWQSMTNNSLLSACLKEVINFQFIVFDVGVGAIKNTVVYVFIGKRVKSGKFH